MRRIFGFALGLALAFSAQAAEPQSTDALLRLLSRDRETSRVLPLGTYPPVARDVGSLVGVHQAALFGVMGPPDSCPWPSFAQCQKIPTWIYSFWPMQKDTSKGAGWSLILDIKDQRVWRAYWIAQ